jgi:hypothetical protein
VGTRMSGSEVRAGETTSRKRGTAPRPDPYHDSGRAVTVTGADCHDRITIEGLLAGVGATPVHPIPSADVAAG